MAHQAYFFAGDVEEGRREALGFAERLTGVSAQGNPDIISLTHGLFSVEDARKVGVLAGQSALVSEYKVLIISATRIFHEAQNALLKLFEEPPAGVVLILILPSAGLLLPTLRSRLFELPVTDVARKEETHEFLALDAAGRRKYIEKLLDRAKSDKDEEKQAARAEFIRLVEGLTRQVHAAWEGNGSEALTLLLRDLDRFLPILHERSAPLKLIGEHLLLVLPEGALA